MHWPEQVEGSFTFTVLDAEDSLYIVKGDNPFCLYYFPRCGLYLYASTEEILCHAIQRISVNLGSHFTVPVKSGEILKISAKGEEQRQSFDDSKLYIHYYHSSMFGYGRRRANFDCSMDAEQSHLDEIKSVAMAFGFTPEEIDHLAAEGFSADELEEVLYGYGGEL